MARTLRFKTIKNVLEKEFDTLQLTGVYEQTLGHPEANGAWLIYGPEKMGKTTLCLILSDMLSKLRKIGYVMAEQGIDKDFQDAMLRLGFTENNPMLQFEGYVSIAELSEELKKKRRPDIIFLDNTTVYADELKGGMVHRLIKTHPNKLFVFIAHEEDGKPAGAVAKLIKKLAKRIIRVEGNRATVDGRTKGGHLIIDEEKAQLYWGSDDTEK